jgi:hypothetical protein
MAKAHAHARPTGITTARPTAIDPALVGLMVKMGADAISSVKGGREILGSLKGQDLFTVAVVAASYEGDEYVVKLRFANASGHGAYVEAIEVKAAQKREGSEAPQPAVRLGRNRSNVSFGDDAGFDLVGLPLYVPPLLQQPVDVDVRITSGTDTWAARDAFGHMIVTVRPLNEEADISKTVTFAIRQRQRELRGADRR